MPFLCRVTSKEPKSDEVLTALTSRVTSGVDVTDMTADSNHINHSSEATKEKSKRARPAKTFFLSWVLNKDNSVINCKLSPSFLLPIPVVKFRDDASSSSMLLDASQFSSFAAAHVPFP